MATDSDLEALRTQIDNADEQLLRLISDRARLAMEVARIKKEADADTTYYRPEREAEVLREITRKNEGPLGDVEISHLFRELMSACLALEQKLEIAYLGPAGTFTQSAALNHFGHAVTTRSQASIAEVFREVESGVCHYGVVPIENSIEGAINQTLDLLVSSSLKICGEVYMRIHHNLLSDTENLSALKCVYSHQQSLAQCRKWLDKNLPGIERVAVSSNAEAAMCAKNAGDTAAIAGDTAAELYDLAVRARNIEDEPDNTTRFLVLGRTIPGPSSRDKTSILFANANVPGALQKSLACFADNNINMNRIESRPSRHGMWEYVFFVDVDGHLEDEVMTKALAELEQHTLMKKVLGCYPAASG